MIEYYHGSGQCMCYPHYSCNTVFVELVHLYCMGGAGVEANDGIALVRY